MSGNPGSPYDALLIVSFGGPEKHEDVIPFLENVLRGRNVPRERMLEVAGHYYHFDGRSPINDQNRALMAALKERVHLPVYWGNRNWNPMLADTVRQMRDDGIRHALAFVTSAFGSYSGCRQYLEDIEKAQAQVNSLGAGHAPAAGNAPAAGEAPVIDKIRPFSAHPKFLAAMTDRVRTAMRDLPGARLVFTAHSVPLSMAQSSPYVAELKRASSAVAAAVGRAEWDFAWQSRSGPPTQPWLEPDICDYLREARSDRIIVPIGFLSDHMEVIYDLDVEARAVADELGIRIARARTVEAHPAILEMIAEMLQTQPESCAAGCCPVPVRPTRPISPVQTAR